VSVAASAEPRRYSPWRRGIVWGVIVAVGLVLAAVAALLWRQHNQAVLERDPSYRYGLTVMDYAVAHANGGIIAQRVCDIALGSRPVPFAHYSKAKARAGCMDEWYSLNN
jgi:zinc transporter ZupT